jgi:hypothetical protein
MVGVNYPCHNPHVTEYTNNYDQKISFVNRIQVIIPGKSKKPKGSYIKQSKKDFIVFTS